MYYILIDYFELLARKSLIVRDLYCRWKRYTSRNFLKEVQERVKIDLFDFRNLARPLPYFPVFFIQDCNYYGILQALLSYSGFNANRFGLRKHQIYLEHGIVIGSLVRVEDIKNLSAITFTYSDYREKYISNLIKTNLYKIGPYIHYVDSLLSDEELSRIKLVLGRVLLVFPSHSIGAVGTTFNHRLFCEEIDIKRKGYDSVIVCMYWKDIENKDYEFYTEKGFKVVTAGHRDDLFFMHRLKSIILLSDMVMSNSLGTHVGYSLFLGKPNYIFRQPINYFARERSGVTLLAMEKEVDATKTKDQKRIIALFSTFNEEITDEQKIIANEIWGFEYVKNPTQLYDIFNLFSKM